MSFEIFTDSSANLSDEIIAKYNLNIVSLVFRVDGEEYVSYEKGKVTDLQQYYIMLREKKLITTSCCNASEFIRAFEEKLEKGIDILYVGFSSGISATYQSGLLAIEELKEKYPDRKIISVDTLAASLGEGLLVYHACMLKEEGKSIEEIAGWLESNKLNLAHWFTVDDLFYLYRGGRVSKSSYVIGNFAKIKPILHVDNAGKLIPMAKVIGRKKSLIHLAERLAESIINPEEQIVTISHGDCLEDVEFLIKKIKEKVTVKEFVVNIIDPVVGAHSGPGTVALFFMAKNR